MSEGNEKRDFVFIIGSPRSGTTILGEILSRHPEICQWYEPYFVWDRHFRNSKHDERSALDATPKIRNQIYKDFLYYKKKMGARLVVDKSPRNSLKIPFILEIFPQVRFIHIIRDGRDVTLSINKEWTRRKNVIQGSSKSHRFDYLEAIKVLKRWLDRQPFVEHKIRALWHETHGHLIAKHKHLNRLRWNGGVGWGPRFKDWADILCRSSMLQFNSYQWLRCVESIQKGWPEIAKEDRLEIRYEEFITKGERTLRKVLEFLNVRVYEGFFNSIPKLKRDNYNKWQKELTRDQLNGIHSILTHKLIELGYERDGSWIA